MRDQRHKVGVECVEVAEEEVMIPIGQAFHLEEELFSCCFIELSTGFLVERHMSHMIVNIFGLVDPFTVLCSLYALPRPEPDSDTFQDIKPIFEP